MNEKNFDHDKNEQLEKSEPGEVKQGKKEFPKFKNNREVLWFLFLTIKENRKWWLFPLFIVLAFLSIFVSLTGNSAMLPAIYALF